ncbi:MAG: hypothetical protein U0575_02660 [Phycisphaerales bacterium]
MTAEPVFVLHGLPGIGKSSLARGLAEIARDSLRLVARLLDRGKVGSRRATASASSSMP